MEFSIKTMPAYHVAYVRETGDYGPEIASRAFHELMQWAGPAGFAADGQSMALYWDDPAKTPKGQCRMDACVTVPEDIDADEPIHFQNVPAGTYAVFRAELADDEFHAAWIKVFEVMQAHGHEMADGVCYELYHCSPNQEPGQKWLVDICIPVGDMP